MTTMHLSVLIEILSRVQARDGDLPVEVVCTSEGIGGDPLVVVEAGTVVLDMDRFSSYTDDEVEPRP